MADITFLEQGAPVEEYGRALYAVARSIIRALRDQLSQEDLMDANTDRDGITMRQLAKLSRLERDKGMRGDGFEWAVHEAIVGREPRIIEPIAEVLAKASRHLGDPDHVSSVLFGHERSKYLGFLDAVVTAGGHDASLLPDGRGHPFKFGPWVQVAAKGKNAERELAARIKKVWKTDLFLGDTKERRYVAGTVKSNWHQLEGGEGLRIGIVPEAEDLSAGFRRDEENGLWVAVLPDPDGFMGLFNDAYSAVARAVCSIGKQPLPPYYLKPTAKAQRVIAQIEKYSTARVKDIEDALNEAAQHNLVTVTHRLVSVEPPPWLLINEPPTQVIAPKPVFEKLD